MKKASVLLAAAAMAFSMVSGPALAQSMTDKMSGMFQCSSACSSEYMQCIANANQLTSDPTQIGTQIISNFQASTACGQQSMACHRSCN